MGNPKPPAVTLDGDIEVIVGEEGFRRLKDRKLDIPPPGAGLDTLT